MKIALLITDNREHFRHYEEEVPTFGTAPEALLQGLARLPEVEVHVVSCTKRVMKSPAKLADNIYFHSLEVPLLGWLRTGYLGCIRAVRKKLREIRPAIVHGQGSERDQNISAVFSGFPNVITIHGNMRTVARLHRAPPFSFLWCAALLEGFVIPRSKGVVCITTYTQELVAPIARRTWLAPNAVDGSFFDIVRAPRGLPFLLCVATVDARKNQNVLIKALDSLKPQGKFEVLFLGSADPRTAYVKEFYGLLETRPWCRFGGLTDRNSLKQYLASAAGLVLPSLEDNCPMTVLEAMASGVPVAAARVGGVPDLIRHAETGLLFDPSNPADIAAAVERLMAGRDEAMAPRARVEARRLYHPEVVARRHLEIYREVLSSGA